jgi:hypothetical protein
MISDYVMTSINSHFNRQILPASHPQPQRATLSRELIHQHLPALIRKHNAPAFVINHTQRKSPSPISKSRLKVLLENNKEGVSAVVRKSPIRSAQLTSQSSVSDLFDCSPRCQEDKENLLDAYCQRRKSEVHSQHNRKVFGRQH